MVVAHTSNEIKEKELLESIKLIGYVLIVDKIRKDAKQTLSYFIK